MSLLKISTFPWELFTSTQRRAYRFSVLALIVVLSLGVALDQLTKHQSTVSLKSWYSKEDLRQYSGEHRTVFVLGDREHAKTTGPYFEFYLSYVRNPGAAWGALSGMDDAIRIPFFMVVTVLCILFILLYLLSTPLSHRLARFAFTLILSGAIGNFVDRVRLHYVVDWIGVRWNVGGWYYAFPNFNVADSLISVGAFLVVVDILILTGIRHRRLARQKESHDFQDKNLASILPT